jgi:lipopolysaccharide biosynthesis protein/tetratricopeptide (TPR) repeat protein
MRRLSLKRRKPGPLTLADRARDLGQWELAAGLYREALDRNPRKPGIWVQYGHALKESGELRDPGKLAQAEVAYRRAVALDPSAADPHLQLGHALKLQGKTEEAQAAYLRAFALDPSMPYPLQELSGLGWSEAQMAGLRGAIAPNSKGGDIVDPPRPGSMRRKRSVLHRADSARDTRQWERAAQLYRKALARNPRNPPIWVQYGHALKESGDLRDPDKLAQAEIAYRRALSLDPTAADSYLQLGHALKLQGKSEEATAAYLRAFALDPSVLCPLEELGGLGWSKTLMAELQGMLADGSSPASAPSDAGIGQSHLLSRDDAQEIRRYWSERFDAQWYLEHNRDVACGGMDPFEHFLTYGLKERRRPNASPMMVGAWRPVTDAEIHCSKEPSFRDEVALFATYSPHGQLKPHVKHYLDSLKRQKLSVILIVNTDRPSTTFDVDFESELDGIFIRRAEGYDFAAWAHILQLHPRLFEAKILYLINDSVIGPTNDAAFGEMLAKIRDNGADLIGLTENNDRYWHLQSYFLAFKSRALSSLAFRKFVNGIVSYEDKVDVIYELEILLAPTLKAAGLDCQALFAVPNDGKHPAVHWKHLLRSGFPFVKVEVIRGLVPDLDISDWRALLGAQGYDVSLAERTVAELSRIPKPMGGSGRLSTNANRLQSAALENVSLVENLVSQGLRESERDSFLRLWSEHFDADWYLQTYPDVADGGMDAFEHFLRYGLKEGRQPSSRLPIRGSSSSVSEAEIHCLKPPVAQGEVALFAAYAPNGRLKPQIRHYLDCLKRHNVGVILIITTNRLFVGEADLVDTLNGMFVREAMGYDFAAWAHVLRLHPELFDAKILYLLNDSVLGPTNDAAFSKLLRRLRYSRADVIGLTQNYVWSWHFQSYFLAFKPRALRSGVFQEFIHDIVAFEDQRDVINQYEFRLAWLLKTAGLQLHLLFPVSRFGDPTVFDWRSLLQSGFPFLKVKTVRDAIPNVDTSGWRELLAAEGYDVSLAEDTLVEISAAERMSHEDEVQTIPYARSAGALRLARRVLPKEGAGLDVLICGHDLSESGAPRAAFDVARVLRGAGHSVVFAAPSDGPYRERLGDIGIEVITDEMLLDQNHDIVDLARNFDKVVCNTIECWPIVAQLRDVVPVYWYIHESDVLHQRVKDFPALLPVLRGGGVTVLAPSPRTANALAVYGVTAQIVEYGIDDPAEWHRASSADIGKVAIGVFGSYEPRKGQDLAVAGMLCVPGELRDQAELRFFGRTLDAVFRSNLEQIAGEERSIVFFGEVDHRECLNQMAACDVVLAPSRDDSLPFVTLDALSLGKTVVCSHSTGTSAYLRDGQSGLILRENTPDEIGRALARAIADPWLRAAFGKGARAVFEHTFSMQSFAKKFQAALGIERPGREHEV